MPVEDMHITASQQAWKSVKSIELSNYQKVKFVNLLFLQSFEAPKIDLINKHNVIVWYHCKISVIPTKKTTTTTTKKQM